MRNVSGLITVTAMSLALASCGSGVPSIGQSTLSNVRSTLIGGQTTASVQYRAKLLPSGFVPYAIMMDGQVAGAMGDQAAIYKNGKVTLLAMYPRCTNGANINTTATSVNVHGEAVGYCSDFNNDVTYPLYWNGGSVRVLRRPGSINNWGFAAAWAINDQDDIYGASFFAGQSSGPSMVRYYLDGQPTKVFEGKSAWAANVFVNDSGHLAFTNSVYEPGNSRSYASVGYNSELTRLFPGRPNTWVAGINDSNLTAGSIFGSNGGGRVFINSANGITIIPRPRGIAVMAASGVNDRNQVIGNMCTSICNSEEVFLYSPGRVGMVPVS